MNVYCGKYNPYSENIYYFFILGKMSNIPHNEIGDWTHFNLLSGSLYLSFDSTCYLVLVKKIFKMPYPIFCLS